MQSHRQKLDVENLARSIRQSNFGWAACRSWEITGCPNLDSPSKVAIHDALPLRYVTVIHRGPPWNPESHRDNLPRLAATCGRLPQLAADCSRLRQNPDSAQGRNCGRTARRIKITHRKPRTAEAMRGGHYLDFFATSARMASGNQTNKSRINSIAVPPQNYFIRLQPPCQHPTA